MFFQADEVPLNGIANIDHGLVACLTLGYTARQGGAFGDENTIFVGFNDDAEFHGASIPEDGIGFNGAVRVPFGNE